MCVEEEIQLDWLASVMAMWSLDIWDTQSGYAGDIEDITIMYQTIGWQFHLNEFGRDGKYLEHNTRKNHTMKWCGVGLAYCGMTMSGGYKLRPGVAKFCLPSTARLNSATKWREAGGSEPERISPKKMRRGDIVVVGRDKSYGTHITMCMEPYNILTRRWKSVECNGVGVTPNHLSGRKGKMEGIVTKTRRIDDVAVVYRPAEDWFVEA